MASPPFSIAETTPGDSDFIRLFPAAERTFRDIVESWLTLEHDATTGRHKFPVDTTANLAGNNYAAGSMRYDTTLDVLQVSPDGSIWDTVSIPPSNSMLIRNTAATAPAGWTKVTLGANYAIVGSDSTPATIDGGSTGFTSVFTSRTIAQANLPNVNFTVSGTAASDGIHNHNGVTGFQSADHTHSVSGSTVAEGDHGHPFYLSTQNAGEADASGGLMVNAASAAVRSAFAGTPGPVPGEQIGGAGGHFHNFSATTGGISAGHTHAIGFDGGHTHSVTGTAASGGSGTAMDFSVLRIGFILCTRAAAA